MLDRVRSSIRTILYMILSFYQISQSNYRQDDGETHLLRQANYSNNPHQAFVGFYVKFESKF